MPMLPTIAELDAAATTVYAAIPPTPQYSWPLIKAALGAEVWIKHENHSPVGAFRLRGGLAYLERVKRRLAEGAGAAALAGALQLKESGRLAGRKIGLALTGGNVDAELFRHVLQGATP